VLRADGGATANGFLMQFQADLQGGSVYVAADADATALGAAALAGLATGVWGGPEAIRARVRTGARYEPKMSREEADARRAEWRRAVERARS
jgi:glycerol kinase